MISIIRIQPHSQNPLACNNFVTRFTIYELNGEIKPEKCTYSIKKDKILIYVEKFLGYI